ncbi:MAG: hypothetical protein Q4F83_04870 [Eubacteriales bacterium]|nr:hypothetical protein [Eubacteriales bacterium]
MFWYAVILGGFGVLLLPFIVWLLAVNCAADSMYRPKQKSENKESPGNE